MDWKELGLQALMGAVYGGAGILAVTQKLNLALLSALAVGVVRGAGIALVTALEPKTTAVNMKKLDTKYSRLKRIL